MRDENDIRLSVGLDAADLRRDMAEISRLSQRFGSTITRAFSGAIAGGKSFREVLRSLALSLSKQALTSALRPVGNLFGSLATGLVQNRISGSQASGVSGSSIIPFAKGGVVNGSTLFPFQGGLGVMGERGHEAIMPLARSSDGSLGVRASSTPSISVTMNITTPDADSFARSRGQVAAQMWQAAQRGRRNL